jgi:hypothetical protein
MPTMEELTEQIAGCYSVFKTGPSLGLSAAGARRVDHAVLCGFVRSKDSPGRGERRLVLRRGTQRVLKKSRSSSEVDIEKSSRGSLKCG